jgi:hypothetical protein
MPVRCCNKVVQRYKKINKNAMPFFGMLAEISLGLVLSPIYVNFMIKQRDQRVQALSTVANLKTAFELTIVNS